MSFNWYVTSNTTTQTPIGRALVPTDVPGCALWLDGADITTINATNILQWNDKSGYGNHMSNNASYQPPIYSPTALNYLPSVQFVRNSSNNFTILENTAFNLPAATTTYSYFIVIQRNGSTTSNQRFFSSAYTVGGNDNNAHSFEIDTYSGNTGIEIIVNNAGVYSMHTTTNVCLVELCVNGTTNLSLYESGNMVMSGSGPSGSLTLAHVRFGAATQTSATNDAGITSLEGNISEVLFYNTYLGTTQLAQVEGYLAWKWGFTSKLPSGHTYKNAAPVGFNPKTSVTGCYLWLDAADSTTIQFNTSPSTTNVATWNDKSGNNNTALQGTAANQPTYSSNSMNFNGSSQYLSIPSPTSFRPLNLFIVLNLNLIGISYPQDIIRKGYDTGSSYEFGFRLTSANTLTLEFRNSSSSSLNITESIPYGSTQLVEYTYNNTTATFYTNGTSNSSGGITGPQFPGSTQLMIGALSTNDSGNTPTGVSDFFNGSINEILIYNQPLSSYARQQIEGYLAWKWQLQLPASNTYVSTAPTFIPGLPQIQSIANTTTISSSARCVRPTDLPGCMVWFDAADSTTITANVAQWNDKSGQTNNATQSTSSNQPTFVVGSGGVTGGGGVVFSGSTANFLTTSYSANQATESIFIVLNETAITGQNDLLIPTAGGRQVYINAGTLHTYEGALTLNAGTVSAVTPTMVEIIYNATPFLAHYINGASQGSTNITGSPGIITSSFTQISDSTNPWHGIIYEILIYNSNITTSDQQLVEGYLAWKWGIQTSLPGIHPYYNAAPTGFNPTTTVTSGTCQLWLDGADTTNVEITVPKWTDKSGNGYNATQSTVANQPIQHSLGLNGLNTLTFNGTSQYFSLPIAVDFGTQDFAIFAVVSLNLDGNPRMIIGKNGGSTPQWRLAKDSGSNPAEIVIYNSSGSESISSLSSPPSGWCVMAGMVYRSTGNVIYFNGTAQGAGTVVNTGSLTSTNPAYIGYGPGLTYGAYWNSDIAEIIILNASLTSSQRQQMEGYLAWKWGLQGMLPATHQYATLAPTFIPALPTIYSSSNLFGPYNVPGLTLWLDSLNGVVTSGSTVTAWNDRSGNGYVFNTSSGSPQYSSTTGVYFNSSTMASYTNIPFTAGISRLFIIVNVTATNGSGYDYIFNFTVGNDKSLRYSLGNRFNSADAFQNQTWFLNGTQGTNTGIPTSIVNTPSLIDGITQFGGPSKVELSSSYNGGFLTGYIQEVLLFSTAITDKQRQQMEGYLSWKWGIQANLPTTHPYYSAAPTFFN